GAGSFPTSIAATDLNGDGKPDLAVANITSVSVLLNQGNGTFAASVFYDVGMVSSAIAASDLNGDGKPDLAVGGRNGVRVLLNQGNGTFAASVTSPTF